MALRNSALKVGVIASALVLGLTGCAQSSGSQADGPQNTQALSIEFNDGWAKSASDANGTSFVAGTLVNASAEQAQFVSASCTPTARKAELVTTTVDSSGKSSSQSAAGGFTIPPGGSLSLQSSGNQLLLSGLTEPLNPGGQVTCDLTFGDSSVLQITAPVMNAH